MADIKLVSITMRYINNTRCFMIAENGFGFDELNADGPNLFQWRAHLFSC